MPDVPLRPERACRCSDTEPASTASRHIAWKPGHGTGIVMSSACDARQAESSRGSDVHSSEWCLSAAAARAGAGRRASAASRRSRRRTEASALPAGRVAPLGAFDLKYV